jgi:hypothetical protein
METIALALGVATAAGALAVAVRSSPVAGWLAASLRTAMPGSSPTFADLPTAMRSFAIRAVDGDVQAPVSDAATLLGEELGAATAIQALADLARRRLAPRVVVAFALGRGRARMRAGTIGVRIVSAADETRLAPLVRRAADQAANRRLAAQLAAVGIGLLFGPEAGLVADAASLAAAGPGSALPPGTRAGDILLSIPVWWRPVARGGAAPADRAARLVAVVRAGRLLRAGVLDERHP